MREIERGTNTERKTHRERHREKERHTERDIERVRQRQTAVANRGEVPTKRDALPHLLGV